MKTAFVLSGGGAKGIFEASVIQELMKSGAKPDFAVGTSAGALNAMGLRYLGPEGLIAMWLAIKGRSDALSLRWWKIPFNGSGVYGLGPTEKKLRALATKAPSTQIEAVTCYVDLRTTLAYYKSSNDCTPEEMIKATLASSAIPFYMEPVDGYLVDGGAREIAPLQYAYDRLTDGDEIVVIICQPVGLAAQDPFVESYPKALSCAFRALDIRDHQVLMGNLEARGNKKIKIRLYAPTRYLYGTFDFDPAKLAMAAAHGVEIAKSGGVTLA